MSLPFLAQQDAITVDEKLMGPLGFSVDQLMELAGLSVACAVHEVYPPSTNPRVLILAGPGNNGGDGLVAARHLRHFRYPTVEICYPKPTDKPLYNGLVTQCKSLALPFRTVEEVLATPLRDRYDVVLDALFGFSFKGQPRPPFDRVLAALSPPAAPPPVASVDIPSGWDVERGDVSGGGIRPQLLVSLTAPKLCARGFAGEHHYLGGRFVPPAIASEYGLQLPEYPGAAQTVRIPGRKKPKE